MKNIIAKITSKVDFKVQPQSIGYLNIYNYQFLRREQSLINGFDSLTLDGFMLSITLRVLTGRKIERLSPDFSSYFLNLFNYLDKHKLKATFIGASKVDLRRFIEKISINFPGVQIVNAFDGYESDLGHIISKIVKSDTEFVFVGMGTPKQESFISALKTSGYNGSCFSCGAFFSQTASKGIQYYPKIMNDLNLRWLYRIYCDPKLLKRYCIEYPKGLYLFIFDFYVNKESW